MAQKLARGKDIEKEGEGRVFQAAGKAGLKSGIRKS